MINAASTHYVLSIISPVRLDDIGAELLSICPSQQNSTVLVHSWFCRGEGGATVGAWGHAHPWKLGPFSGHFHPWTYNGCHKSRLMLKTQCLTLTHSYYWHLCIIMRTFIIIFHSRSRPMYFEFKPACCMLEAHKNSCYSASLIPIRCSASMYAMCSVT